MKRHPKKILTILTTFILPAFILTAPIVTAADQVRIIRIVDGDTVVVNYQGNNEKARMLCVNTPESAHPNKKQNIPMGKIASDYTEKRLTGKYVDLEFEGPIRGRYGRLLAYVFVEGVNFNLELVRQGLSPYYTKYGLSQKYDQEFRKAERHARKHKLNIWGDPKLIKKYLRLKSEWGQYRSQTVPQPNTVQPKEWKYMASKNSKVFHHPNCKWAKKIHPSNLIGFSSRQEAMGSGRRPCRVCTP